MQINYYYSAITNVFYYADEIDLYNQNGTWPDDTIAITDDVFYEFTSAPPVGKKRIAGSDGMPAWGDITGPTHDDLVAAAEQQKSALLTTANNVIATLQDAVELDMATDDEQALLLTWKKYRVLLNRVDTSAAPGIEWPTQPDSQAI